MRSCGPPRWCAGSTPTGRRRTSIRHGAVSSTELGFPEELTTALLDPEKIEEFCDTFPGIGLARQAHACTHTTIAPTILRAGSKINVIPDRVELELDIRTLPGWGTPEVTAMLEDVLGDLYGEVEVEFMCEDLSTTSPADTPLWSALERAASESYPGSRLVPYLTVGATDARIFRRLGTVAYGFGLVQRDDSVSRITRRCSTVSTSESTSTHSGSLRSFGDTSPATPSPAEPGQHERSVDLIAWRQRRSPPDIDAVLFDFGGVLADGPFDAFARYEEENGLPNGFVRRLNASDHDTNAWARLERGEVSLDEFYELFEHEAKRAGGTVDARALIACSGW